VKCLMYAMSFSLSSASSVAETKDSKLPLDVKY
jgi:hypothetical protein